MDLNVEKEFLIFELVKATTRDGRPFLKLILSDEGGSLFNGIMFDTLRLDFEPVKGDTVAIKAVLQHYNNQAQLKITDMSFVRADGAEAFLPKSKFECAEMEYELRRYLDKYIKSDHFKQLLEIFYTDAEVYSRFIKIPAAKTVHHAFIHGLLEHTLGVVKNAVYISTLYPRINRELLILGALFHDVGKVQELDIESGFDYTDDGKFLGHLMLGYSLVDNYIKGIEGFPEDHRKRLLHMIASHHGQLEFGSPQVPKTLEAIALSYIDDIDAKLNNFSSILERENVEDGAWSSYDRLLERQIYKPKE